MMSGDGHRRNRNRGFFQLIVWQDATKLYRLTWEAFRGWPFERRKVASQQIASVDSIHRNIAEGDCRRSLKEYLNFLNIARGSLGEGVSGFLNYHQADRLNAEQFDALDSLAYKLENGLIKLIGALEGKRDSGDWKENLSVREKSTVSYLAKTKEADWLREWLDESFFSETGS